MELNIFHIGNQVDYMDYISATNIWKTKLNWGPYFHFQKTNTDVCKAVRLACVSSKWPTLRQVTDLVSHNHRGASVDSQDWKLSLNGQEVKDLGNGFLIGAISKHDAMETSARKKLTHLGTK